MDHKKTSSILLFFLVTMSFLSVQVFAWEATGRYRDLIPLDVKNNVYKLRTARKCVGCFLVDAYLVGLDLRGVNLRAANLTRAKLMRASLYGANLSGVNFAGANLSGAQWINGKICQSGSIGRCITK